MADYFPVLSRAVAGLESNTGETRRAVYDRARAAIVRQLRSLDPPVSEEDISREQAQLEEAILKVEAGAAGSEAAAPQAVKPAAPPAGLPPAPAPLQQKPPLERKPADRPAAGAAPAPRRDEPARPASGDRREPQPPREAASQRREPQPARDGAPPADAAQPRPAKRADGRPIIAATGGAPATPAGKRSGPLIALALLALVAVGAGLFVARDRIAATFGGGRPAEVADATAPTAPPADSNSAEPRPADPKPAEVAPTDQAADAGRPEDKSDDRLPQDAAAERPPTDAPPAATPPPGDQQVARAPDATAPPPAVAEPPTDAQPEASSQPAPLVAQRAVLYEEGPNQQSGEALNGAILWRTESVTGGPNQPLEQAIRGDIDIPGRKLRATITIRRNIDATLPASHTIELQFTLPDDFPNAGISNVPGVLMKADESARGAAVAGLSVRVTSGFFLIGLSNLDTERSVNEQLLKDRGWIDVPVLYDNGRRAVLTLEKGTPGTQAFQEAFAAWKSASVATTPGAAPN